MLRAWGPCRPSGRRAVSTRYMPVAGVVPASTRIRAVAVASAVAGSVRGPLTGRRVEDEQEVEIAAVRQLAAAETSHTDHRERERRVARFAGPR